MGRAAHILIVLAMVSAAGCGDSSESGTTPPPLTTPTPPLPPPVSTYTLSGVIRETWTLLPVAGVTVAIVAGPTRASVMTDTAGRFALTNLTAGLYDLSWSKAFFTTRTQNQIQVLADTTFDATIGVFVQGTATEGDVTGSWVGNGPYPDEPLWLTLIQRGSSIEGFYKDRVSSTTSVTGTRTGDVVVLRLRDGPQPLTYEGRVLDPRCIRGVIKNEALGGNFPVRLSRGTICSP
ncbi:MAG TPA: carboxypeptidase-like regulatory domain-containing protein [Vicinamibacterales bacterium]|nr:carboxypeptidase-like regulatory domain-containing protein [Vicinamibacterales bacterium]